ncbi:restriction endonuclease subunit S [Ligilactobacillus salivarius]|uniref:Type I restriction modification DNA specificity domain-containing protein n=2 Tax=Ligilactobacillus salivarius TaxID=1624 RepID=A0A1V9U673_9LACO|nr:restriction endonuclease subunit S [Ligilactobacillus salivarius]OQR25398.1 hypothetical protein B6U37_04950 [Ligilactobacillus salivarius]
MFPTQFTGASFTWEQVKLEKIAAFSKGKDYSKLDLKRKGYPIFLYGQMYTDYRYKIVETSTYASLKKDAVVSNGNEIVIPSSGETSVDIARASWIAQKGIILGSDLNIIRPTSSVHPLFLALSLSNNQVKYNLAKVAQGNSIVHLYNNNLKKVNIYFPNIVEQNKIGNILNSISNCINLHEDHLQFLHSFKSFLLQKMFFDNDVPPLLRFNKFTEKWNQCRLNDHAIVTMGQSPNSKNYTNNQTDKILVQGNADLYKNKVLKRVFTTEITKTAVKNDILISVRAPVGDIARNQYESVVIGRGIASIKGNDFLYYQLEKMKNSGFWNKYIAGSTFESITGKDLKNAKIYTTNSDEERKIGNIFSSLTKIIQLQEHKIDSLKKLKQFLLQNMFI